MMFGGMLYNTKLKRFHPIFFRPAPMPGRPGQPGESVLRYKSHAHHTEGFTTLEWAEAKLRQICDDQGWTATDRLYEWDGEGVPAIVDFLPHRTPAGQDIA